MKICANELSGYYCARLEGHPGVCIAETGHWWAKYDSGRDDKEPNSPLPELGKWDTPDYRKVWLDAAVKDFQEET